MTGVSSAPSARPTTATTAPSSTIPRTPVTPGRPPQRLGDGLAGGRGAQGRLERLPDVGDRQGVQHGDRLGGGGLLRHVVAGPGTQLLGGRGGSGGEGDEGDGHLAGVDVRSAHGLGAGDRGVGQQGVLDDGGVDVVAAADDEVLRPADEVDEAVVVDLGQVPGVQPTVAQLAQPVQHGSVRASADDVAGEDGRPADGQHPDPPGRQVDPLAVGGDLDGLRPAGRAGAGRRTRDAVAREAQRADAGGLGEAVALDQPRCRWRTRSRPGPPAAAVRRRPRRSRRLLMSASTGQPARTEYTVGTALIVVTR